MKIVFTMAGASARFAAAGYAKPKYMLSLGEKFAANFGWKFGLGGVNSNENAVNFGANFNESGTNSVNFEKNSRASGENSVNFKENSANFSENGVNFVEKFSKNSSARGKNSVNFTLFYYAVGGFKAYFRECEFIFIYRNLQNTGEFIRKECARLGVAHFRAVELAELTQGQAHSLYLGLQSLKMPHDESILVFNIDSFRPNFTLPRRFDLAKIDGYLEVFRGEGEQWSFVLPADFSKNSVNFAENLTKNGENLPRDFKGDFEAKSVNFGVNSAKNSVNFSKNAVNFAKNSRQNAAQSEFKVAKTAEKERISPLCSTGLYYFARFGDFALAFENALKMGAKTKNEYYIAPLYNALIARGADIRYDEIAPSEVIFCGTPSEYKALG